MECPYMELVWVCIMQVEIRVCLNTTMTFICGRDSLSHCSDAEDAHEIYILHHLLCKTDSISVSKQQYTNLNTPHFRPMGKQMWHWT